MPPIFPKKRLSEVQGDQITIKIKIPFALGKSTLLKMLAGALQPSAGSVALRGRVGTLLDLGSGIHPEYTGAENALADRTHADSGIEFSDVSVSWPPIVMPQRPRLVE